MPTEGCSLWSDNMVIPVGAPNVGAALRLDGLHLRAGGQRARWPNTSPTSRRSKGCRTWSSPELAKDPLVFPQPKFTSKCTDQDSPPDIEPVNEAWQEVITG